MSESKKPSQEEIDSLYLKLKKDAESGGYNLNPDVEFTKALVDGLLVNQYRYGYIACPCRLADGTRAEDLDIICPCDYRDPDLEDFDACFCGLYVTKKIVSGEKKLTSIPERRPVDPEKRKKPDRGSVAGNLPYPVWRCTVCGYLCARNEPPSVCPVCKVDKDRFERFM
jgi:ferredoxin-thioredoxin reductase catalytic subunit/rubredoxin